MARHVTARNPPVVLLTVAFAYCSQTALARQVRRVIGARCVHWVGQYRLHRHTQCSPLEKSASKLFKRSVKTIWHLDMHVAPSESDAPLICQLHRNHVNPCDLSPFKHKGSNVPRWTIGCIERSGALLQKVLPEYPLRRLSTFDTSALHRLRRGTDGVLEARKESGREAHKAHILGEGRTEGTAQIHKMTYYSG